MVRRVGIFILLISFFLSCSVDDISDGNIRKEMLSANTQKQLESEAAYMRYPFRIRLVNSLLYVMDLHAPDAYCHQFDYAELNYRQSFAPRGEAPCHFLGAENIRVDTNGNIHLLDANRGVIANIDVKTGNVNSELKLPEALIRVLDFVQLSDSVFIVPDYTGNHRLTFVNMNGEIIKHAFHIPAGKKEKISGILLAQAWRSFIDYNPDNGILAMATQLGQVVEIYDIKNDSVINVVTGKHGKPEFIDRGGYAVPNGIMGYSDIHVGKEHIHAVFWGTSFKNIRAGRKEKEGGNIIHVFDLKGNPVVQYELDRYITSFCIDEENKKMIALDVNSDQPVVEYVFSDR